MSSDPCTGNLLTRKSFLRQSSLTLLGASLFPWTGIRARAAEAAAAARGPGDGTLRSIAYNIFNGAIGYQGINGRELPAGEERAPLRAARELGQIPKRIMLELALCRPNLINFSESPGEGVVKEMAGWSGMNHAFFPGGIDGKGHFPGSILTTLEIVTFETRPFLNKSRNNPKELFTRHWGKAKLRLPSERMITIHSAHLWPFKKEANDTEIRLREIKELLAAIRDDLDYDSDSVLLQGDLNHEPDTPEYEQLREGGLVDVFQAAGRGDGFTHSSIRPAKRIDFIYAAGGLAKQIQRCEALFQGGFRMNQDDPTAFALSDHLPVLADFKLV